MHSFLNENDDRTRRKENLLEGKEFWKGPQSLNFHRKDEIHVGHDTGMLALRARGEMAKEISTSISEGEFVRVVLLWRGRP